MGQQQPVAAPPRVGVASARFRRLAVLVLAAASFRDLHLRAAEPAFRLAASENQVAIASVNRAGVGAVWSYDLHDKEVKLTWRAP